MGINFGHENVRNVRSGKGVQEGCGVVKTSVNLLTMAAGRVKFGLTAADITALGGQMLNEGGAEANVSSATLNTASLATDTKYVVYLKTDGTLSTTPETGSALTTGPMVLTNVSTPAGNVQTLHTPSVRICNFKKSSTLATQATGTVTIAGTVETDNIVTVVIDGVSVPYTVLAGDTTATLVAVGVKNAINASTAAAALVTATNVAGVVTLTAVDAGEAGNAITLTTAVTGTTPTTTSTASGATLAGAISGGIVDLSYNMRETA